jgi:hypothetical protein
MNPPALLLALSCLAGTPAFAEFPLGEARAARLLPTYAPASFEGGERLNVSPRRESKLLQGVLVTGATGLALPVFLLSGAGGILGSSTRDGVTIAVGSVGASVVLTPLLVYWVMDGAPLQNRVLVGTLLGAVAWLVSGLVLAPFMGAAGFVAGMFAPGLGAVIAIESARQEGLYDAPRMNGWSQPPPAVAFRF